MTKAEYQGFIAHKAEAEREIKQNIYSMPGPILGSTFNYRKFSKPGAYRKPVDLTLDEIAFIRTVADNIYTFAVGDGMGRAFEAMRGGCWVAGEGE